MKVDKRKVKPLVFTEGENTLTVGYSNRGDPFRDGVEMSFECERCWVAVLLDEDRDVQLLRDKLSEFLGTVSRVRGRNLVVCLDGAPVAIMEPTATELPDDCLHWYANQYAIDRGRLTYISVEIAGREVKS